MREVLVSYIQYVMLTWSHIQYLRRKDEERMCGVILLILFDFQLPCVGGITGRRETTHAWYNLTSFFCTVQFERRG